MDTPAAPSRVACTYGIDYTHLVDARFLQATFDRDLVVYRDDRWITRSGLNDAPGTVLAKATYCHVDTENRLVDIDGVVVHLTLKERALHVRAAAADDVAAAAALMAVRVAMPEVDQGDREVPVRFWWWQPSVAREMARMMPAPTWTDISDNYASSTAAAVRDLVHWREGPPAGGRLLLWHGAPGTGKTTALRSLARAWRSWADFQFVTDPEEFLQNSSYLLQAISGDRHGSLEVSPAERWRVLVLEDSGEFLAPDAKHVAGQALSRLLNVCDGVLGQSTRCLILVTTNEPVRSLHPALARPGRCLSQIEFAELTRQEIELWCAARGIEPPGAGRAALADLFAAFEGRSGAARSDSGFGFAGAEAA